MSEMLVFCISEQVLCAYAHAHEMKGTFLYSEQRDLDEEILNRHLHGGETVVLLLVASGSSFLWFDKKHHPMTCKLKSLLRKKKCQLLIVVCPTTPADQRRCEKREALSEALRQEWPGFSEAAEVPGECARVDLRAFSEQASLEASALENVHRTEQAGFEVSALKWGRWLMPVFFLGAFFLGCLVVLALQGMERQTTWKEPQS